MGRNQLTIALPNRVKGWTFPRNTLGITQSNEPALFKEGKMLVLLNTNELT